METTIEIKSIFGNVLFSYECENNTIKKTVEQAVKNNKDLRGSDLSGSDLRGSDLSGSDLRSSNLSNSNLSNSNLSNSNLSNSNLSNINLSNSDLSNSDLSGSDLSGSDLSGSNLSGSKNKETAYLPIFCKWSNSILGDQIQIGCKLKSIEEWDIFFNSDEVYSTPRNTPDFKQIQAVYEAYKAYLIFLAK